jgi:hypothetical protein
MRMGGQLQAPAIFILGKQTEYPHVGPQSESGHSVEDRLGRVQNLSAVKSSHALRAVQSTAWAITGQ